MGANKARSGKVQPHESDKLVRAHSDPEDPDRDLKWSDKHDWTCPKWPGDKVPTDPKPWLKLIEGKNLPTQRAILIVNVNAVCAVNPFSACARLSQGAASINRAIDDFVAHGLPLERYKHPKYKGSRKHKDNVDVGVSGLAASVAAMQAINAKKHVDFAAARAKGIHLDKWGDEVDPDKATQAQETGFLRRQAGDDLHRQAGLATVPTGRELTVLLRVNKPFRPPWDDPVRDFATQIVPFDDLGGKVRDHKWWDCGQQRTCPTSNLVNAAPLYAIDFLVRCGAKADDVADFATNVQEWLGRAGGAKPRFDSFLAAPENAAPAGTTVRTLRSALVPKARELRACVTTDLPADWRLPRIAVVVVDVLASSRDVGSAEICEVAFDVRGAGNQHVSFSSSCLPRGPITHEAWLGHGITKTMLIEAGAPELGKVLEEASLFLNDILGERDYVFCANDARDFVAPLLGRLTDELGRYGFSNAPWVDLGMVARLVAPAGERMSTESAPYSLPALYTTATAKVLAPQCSAYRRARAVGHVLTWLVRMANVEGDWEAAWYRFLDAFHQSPDSRLAADPDAADPDADMDASATADDSDDAWAADARALLREIQDAQERDSRCGLEGLRPTLTLYGFGMERAGGTRRAPYGFVHIAVPATFPAVSGQIRTLPDLKRYLERALGDAKAPARDADPDAETDLDEGAGDPTRIDMRRRAVVRDVVSTRFALRLFAPRGAATTPPPLLDDDDDDDNASRRKRARTTPHAEQPAPEPRPPGAVSPPREPRDRAVAASGVDPRFAILDHASAAHAAATAAVALLPVGEPSALPVVDLDGLSASAHAEFLLSVASSFEAKCRAAATVVEE